MKEQKQRELQGGISLKYGGYSALLVAGVLVILIAINLLFQRIPLRVDLTVEKFYTLSDQTLSVLRSLEEDVTIYGLYEAGSEDIKIVEILRKYQDVSKRIGIEYVDPYLNPGLNTRFEVRGDPPGEGSLVVESDKKFKVLKFYELFDWETDQNYQTQAQSLKAEQMLTSAVVHVTSEKSPVIYALRGHDEKSLPTDLVAQMEQENYTIKELVVAANMRIPPDADIILILSPKLDLSESEEKVIREFLFVDRGEVLFLANLGFSEQPNLDKLLAGYGVGIGRYLVIEGSSDWHVPAQPIALFPELSDHSITESLRGADMPVIIPLTQAVEVHSARRRSVEIEPLLTTSQKAWGETTWETAEWEKSLGDPVGPFTLAVAITDKGEAGQSESKAVVIAGSMFLYPPESIGRLPENYNLLLNSLNWLQGKEELIAIRPKTISHVRYRLHMNQLQFFVFAGITVILVPIIILGTGLAVWLKRRHL